MVESMEQRNSRKRRTGRVVSDRMSKTRVILVETKGRHPLFRKVVRHRKKFYVHDENNESKMGDMVEVEETRPLSKLKRWRLVSIIERAPSSGEQTV